MHFCSVAVSKVLLIRRSLESFVYLFQMWMIVIQLSSFLAALATQYLPLSLTHWQFRHTEWLWDLRLLRHLLIIVMSRQKDKKTEIQKDIVIDQKESFSLFQSFFYKLKHVNCEKRKFATKEVTRFSYQFTLDQLLWDANQR